MSQKKKSKKEEEGPWMCTSCMSKEILLKAELNCPSCGAFRDELEPVH